MTSRTLSRLLRTRPQDGGHAILFYCPGCRSAHRILIDVPGQSWSWSGDLERPTFTPSLKTFTPAFTYTNPQTGEPVVRPERILCHLHVRDGRIEFLDDSMGHKLRGFHDMVPFPEGYGT